jgi:hypothetical protein
MEYWSNHFKHNSYNPGNIYCHNNRKRMYQFAGSATAAPRKVPAAPIVSVENNCESSTLSTTAEGILLWNTGATTSSITVTTAGTYTVTTTVEGCTSSPGRVSHLQ